MFARTERLLLRPGWLEDAPALHQAIADEAICRNLTRVPHPYGMEDARAFLAMPPEPALPRLLMFQRTVNAPRLVGGIGIHRDEEGEPELGYWVARPFWGLGFATEAGRAVIEMARGSLRLPRLRAGHATDNPASAHVLRKLGFRPTGQVRTRHSLGRGGPMECVDMELALADEAPVRLAA